MSDGAHMIPRPADPDLARFLEAFRVAFEQRVQETVAFESTRREVLSAFDRAAVLALTQALRRGQGVAV